MKNVLFLMTDLEGGGAEKALVSLLREFDYSQYRVTLCLLFNRGIYIDNVPKQVKFVYFFEKEESYWNRKAVRKYYRHHNPIVYSILFHLKLRYKYDTIISFMEGRPAMLHSLIMKRGKKNISWIHCDLINYHSSHTCYDNPEHERDCYGRMDELVFVSRTAMNGFSQLYNIDTMKRFLYNIVDKDAINQQANELTVYKSRFTITAIGSLCKVKGFERLVRVVKLLKESGYLLCCQIIGEGEERAELENLIAENNLQEDVKLFGFLKNPYPYLKNSDILVSTSYSEGLSYVICEALVLGVPIVATRTAGSIELLEDGNFGVLTEHDIQSIYGGIKKVIDESALYEELKQKAILRSEIFSIRQTMEQIYQLMI